MLPSIKDLVLAVNKALSGLDWNNNWQKIVNWLSDGKTDIKVKSVEVAQDGGIVNNGSFTQDGNLTVDGDLEVGNITSSGKISGDGSGLYNLVTQGVQAFTPFCVNKGFVTSGNGDLIVATPETEGGNIVRFGISFKVDDGTTYGKLKATTAEGSTFELDHINNDTLASNGTFYYFIAQGQTAITRLSNINIYRQPTQPANTVNDVWLDTSTENLVSYKCNDGGIWEKWDFVPIGKVKIENIGGVSATATVETYPYNFTGIGRKFLETSETHQLYLIYDNSSHTYKKILEQWGTGDVVPAGSTITFGISFSSTPRVWATQATSVNDYYCWVGSKNITTSSFDCRIEDAYGNGNTGTVNWYAIGIK